jgi:uncharacterized protein YlzI (FlbEa/FlbD family)
MCSKCFIQKKTGGRHIVFEKIRHVFEKIRHVFEKIRHVFEKIRHVLFIRCF